MNHLWVSFHWLSFLVRMDDISLVLWRNFALQPGYCKSYVVETLDSVIIISNIFFI